MRRESTTAALAASILVAAVRVAAAEDPANAAARARAAVGRVFAAPEFTPLSEADKIPRLPLDVNLSWVAKIAKFFGDALKGIGRAIFDLLRWIVDGMRGLFGGEGASGEPSSETMRLVGWALGIAAVATVVWLLVRHLRAAEAERRARTSSVLTAAGDDSGADDALARTPDEWRRSAEELAESGKRRESIRALYLALLAGLHHAGAIDYDRTRTNTAYVGDVRPGHAGRRAFQSVTARFDLAWYGHREPTAEELDAALAEAEDVLHAFAKEAVRA